MPATITPQEAVNRFGPRPSECDVVVIVLWSRLGTHLDVKVFSRPDGEPFRSGTEWEFDDAWNGWKARQHPEILVYRRTEEPKMYGRWITTPICRRRLGKWRSARFIPS